MRLCSCVRLCAFEFACVYMRTAGNVWNEFILTKNSAYLEQWRHSSLQCTPLGNSCIHPKVASAFQNGLKSSLFRDRYGLPSR